MDAKRLAISICGGTGSGKSSLAIRLVETLGPTRACQVPADWYLLDADANANANASRASRYGWDWTRFGNDLDGPDGTEIRRPSFNFSTMRRSPEGVLKTFTLCQIMIVEAMQLSPPADLIVFLAVPSSERRRRLAERDRRWANDVLGRRDQLETSRLNPESTGADLVPDGQLPLDRMAQRVFAMLPSDSLDNSSDPDLERDIVS